MVFDYHRAHRFSPGDVKSEVYWVLGIPHSVFRDLRSVTAAGHANRMTRGFLHSSFFILHSAFRTPHSVFPIPHSHMTGDVTNGT